MAAVVLPGDLFGNGQDTRSLRLGLIVLSERLIHFRLFESQPQDIVVVRRIDGHGGPAVEGPAEFQGALLKTIMQRRGTVMGTTEEDGGYCRVEAEVPLAEMFGYATDLRSTTQGKAEFTMEFARYRAAPQDVQSELKEKYKSKIADGDE